jgi:lantibiotic modifying enzyme
MLILFSLLMLRTPVTASDKTYREAAMKAAEWIRASAIESGTSRMWPADPKDPKSINTGLYSGVPGVVLFFLEAYKSTGDQSYLKDARTGADYLIAAVPEEKQTGLYTGLGGIGFVLHETFKVTGDQTYRKGAERCVQLIKDRAVKTGRGVEWSDVTDIISGSAGTGLFLIYAAREMKDASALELAAQAGLRMIELGQAEGGGLKWAMTPKFARLMPNFSHGTAGNAYFLATLYQETKKKEFLDAALSGAKYLKSIAKTEGDVCLVFHNEPEGKELFYLGWCHGPVGTARLFYRLYQTTGDKTWLDREKKSAQAVIESGVPEKQTPGFWNNVSQCCGSAGVAEFFLSLHKLTKERRYLDFSKRVTANLLTRSTSEGAGIKWIQAEHRVKPELLVAQTGYMQGAAGIGILLFHMDNFEQGKSGRITFPDSPF